MKFWVWLDGTLVGWVIAADMDEAETLADQKFATSTWGVRHIAR